MGWSEHFETIILNYRFDDSIPQHSKHTKQLLGVGIKLVRPMIGGPVYNHRIIS